MTHVWILWLLAVAAFDFRQRRVPNWLSLAGAVVAIAALVFDSQPFGIGWRNSAGGAAVGFGVLLMLYATGLMGAGDVKFAGALGLWVGFAPLMPIWVGASFLAGVHAALWLALDQWPVAPRLALALSGVRRGDIDAAGPASSRLARQRHVPYAAYLSLATLAWLATGRTLLN
ncbi:A24 family peptidase [Variovorax sp. RHLX14]|uniref:A24 family peptidase n=1 Tax=Variovorax sp. RHLX14 TaxID=1259731 RepID=UPI003F45287E